MRKASFLLYPYDSKVQSHYCSNLELSETVSDYIEGRYGFTPQKQTTYDWLMLNAPGPTFGTNLPLLQFTIEGLEYRIHPSHVSLVFEFIERRRNRITVYGGVIEAVKVPMHYGLAIIEKAHIEPLLNQLQPLVAESDSVVLEHLERLAQCKSVHVPNHSPEFQ